MTNLSRLNLCIAAVAVFSAACGKAAPTGSQTVPPKNPIVAQLHWLGKAHLATDASAASLMRIWNEPESTKLEAQTLDKLSTAPWRLLPNVATTNAAKAPLLRALLEDCVRAESYLELRAPANQPGEIAFAIRLPAARAALWQSNLAAVVESLTGLKTGPLPLRNPASQAGWALKKHKEPDLIEFVRSGEWVVVGLGQNQNTLLEDFVDRIARSRSPVRSRTTDSWVDATADLRRVGAAFKLNWQLPENFPEISIRTYGDGKSVQTRGSLDFSAPLKLDLGQWQIPKGLVRPPLATFTAARGIRSWLGPQKWWTELQFGPPPDQLFCWSLLGGPQLTFLAAPFQDASARVAQISDVLLGKYIPMIATNDLFSFAKSPDSNGLIWQGTPYLAPYLKSVNSEGRQFAFIGLFPNLATNGTPLPEPLLAELRNRTNLLYYGWELTGARIESLLYISQFSRLFLQRSQLPPGNGLSWLKVNTTNLSTCVTELLELGPDKLSLVRQSNCGFSAFELHVLVDWLESPQFPYSFHTLLTPAPPRLKPGKIILKHPNSSSQQAPASKTQK